MESRTAEGQLVKNERREAVGADKSRGSDEISVEAKNRKDEKKNVPGGKLGAWASGALWGRKVRIAPGKTDEEQNKS